MSRRRLRLQPHQTDVTIFTQIERVNLDKVNQDRANQDRVNQGKVNRG